MKHFLLFCMTMAVVAGAAQTLQPGMYYMAGDTLLPIESQMGYSILGRVGTGGGNWRVSFTTNYTLNFYRPEADVTTSTTPQFLLVYNPKAKGVMINYDVFNCKQTSDPNLAVLLRLTQKKKKRVLNVMEGDWYSFDTLIIEPLDDHQYQLRTLHPLPAGEYGFFFQMPSLGGMYSPIPDCVWAFSVKKEE